MSLPDEAISDEGLDYTALPLGWAISKISDAINIDGVIADGDWIESKDQDPNGGVRLIQLADIGDGYFRNKSERFMTTENAIRMNCTFLKSGDVLIARMPDPLGRACIFSGIDQETVTVVDICLIRVNIESAIKNKLLMYWINTPQVRNYIAMQSTGTTRKRITRKKLEVLELPIPPLAEQQQIATKLDELLAQVDNLKTRLDNIPKILKRFRQSVLAAAVSGKLTTLNNVAIDISCLKKLCKITGGKTPSKANSMFWTNGNIFWVSPKDMKTTEIYSSQDTITELALSEGGMKIIPINSILMVTRSGILAHSFPVAITKVEVTINQDIKAFIPNIKKITPMFACILMRSLSSRILNECSKDGTTVSSVETSLLENLEFQLPPIEEQTEIVARVEQLFTYADQIEQRVKDAQSRVNHLTQAILAKAFRGDLTAEWRAQNPELISGENSAEKLLAKIKAEREQTQFVKKAKATSSN